MEEAKTRTASINALTSNKIDFPSNIARECCYLQLRMLCELIALGCLVAHGDIEATKSKDFQKAYLPAEILSRLEALHPEFYPSPRVAQKTPTGWHLADYDGPPYLTKEELRTLHGKCGDVLHRGSLKRLSRAAKAGNEDFGDVTEWGQKILNLLSVHCIITLGAQRVIVTFLEVTNAGGAVQCAMGAAPGA
jgi:hypothetical protein